MSAVSLWVGQLQLLVLLGYPFDYIARLCTSFGLETIIRTMLDFESVDIVNRLYVLTAIGGEVLLTVQLTPSYTMVFVIINHANHARL